MVRAADGMCPGVSRRVRQDRSAPPGVGIVLVISRHREVCVWEVAIPGTWDSEVGSTAVAGEVGEH